MMIKGRGEDREPGDRTLLFMIIFGIRTGYILNLVAYERAL